MIIRGNTVSTTMPRTNYEQTDPAKGDYLRGKTVLDQKIAGMFPKAGGTMEGPIDMNGQVLKGLNAPAANDHAANMSFVNQQVRKATPRNLLDNSDFRNPVNQRGKNSYSGQGYDIDRWRSWNGENVTTVNSGSVSCTKQLYQCVGPQKLKPDTRYTLAARLADGTVYCVSGQLGEKTENEKLHMEFQAETPAVWLSGGSWLWASLYEGEYTAETLPEYRPKGYGAELAECQRYFLQYNFSDVILPAKMYSGGGSADVSFFLPCTMRLTKPTVSVTASQCQLFANSSNTSCNITEAYLATGNFVGFTAVAESNLDGSAVAVCRIMGKLTLSADL